MTQRSSGFYAVAFHQYRDRASYTPEWTVGYWNGKYWALVGAPYPYHDGDFEAISDSTVEVVPELAEIIFNVEKRMEDFMATLEWVAPTDLQDITGHNQNIP